MNAPPWPVNPGVGQMFQNWVWSGSQWIATPTTGMRVVTQTFIEDGSYMPSPGLVSLTVECIGAGAGAGAAPAAANSARSGAGGGSGGYSRKTIPAALVRGGVPVTIGYGGAAGSSNNAFIGQPGTSTSFGALCVANGGLGGPGIGQGGHGAAPGIGDVALPGNAGHSGSSQVIANAQDYLSGGMGGSIWGGAVSSPPANQGQNVEGPDGMPNTGAGGTGGVANGTTTPIQGGAGGSGLCVVTEYCWGDRDDVAQWSPPVNVNLNWPRPPFPPGGPWPWPPGPWPRSEDDP